MRPPPSCSCSFEKFGSNLRLKPTSRGTPVCLTTARQASTRARSRSIGFSQNTALPARAAASIRIAWVSVELAITTAWIAGSASAAAASPTAAPWRSASLAAAATSTSTTVRSRAPGWRAMLAAWIAPIRPAPNWQKLIIGRASTIVRRKQNRGLTGGQVVTTIRLTMAQALVRFLAAQRTTIDGAELPLIAGVFAIFGHGNVAGLGEALHGARETLPTLRAHNEQAMA